MKGIRVHYLGFYRAVEVAIREGNGFTVSKKDDGLRYCFTSEDWGCERLMRSIAEEMGGDVVDIDDPLIIPQSKLDAFLEKVSNSYSEDRKQAVLNTILKHCNIEVNINYEGGCTFEVTTDLVFND